MADFETPGDHYLANPFVESGDFFPDREAELVHVSGSGPNIFGHTLLCFNRGYGIYAHVHKPGWNYPDVLMSEGNFDAYCKAEKKTVLKRDFYLLEDKLLVKAQLFLKKRLGQTYFWGGALHNCAEWAADIINAGRPVAQHIALTACGMSLPTLMISKTTKDTGDGKGVYHRLND